MNTVLWIATGLLAAAFLGVGLAKLIQPKEQLEATGLAWTEDFSPLQVKAIGALEVAAGLGLFLPAVTGISPALVPIAAVALVVLMVLAAIVHLRRDEASALSVNAVLAALALFVAWGRFGPYAF